MTEEPASAASSSAVQGPDSTSGDPSEAGTNGVDGSSTPDAQPPAPDSAAQSDGSTAEAPSPASSAPPLGNVDQTVDAGAEVVNAPVEATATADVGGSVTARISEVGPRDVTAVMPGEAGGNVVAVTVVVTNGSQQEISLASSTVTLVDGAGGAASSVTSDPARPLTGQLKPGDEATGLYLFDVPQGARSGMSLTVSYAPGQPTALFQGVSSA